MPASLITPLCTGAVIIPAKSPLRQPWAARVSAQGQARIVDKPAQLAERRRQIGNRGFQVRGYTYSGKVEAEQPALDAIDNALKKITELEGQLPAQYQANLQEASVSLQAYRAAVSQYRDSQVASAAALKIMTEQGDILLGHSEKLTASQTVVRDTDAALAKNFLLLATVLALVFGLIAAWAITRQIIIPLNQTLQVAERVASGDLSHNLTSVRQDELGQLQRAMQSMTVGLRELIGGVSDGVTQIASAAEQLSAVTEQTSAGVNSQKVETDQVATAMHEMAATVQEVARNAEEASEASWRLTRWRCRC